MQHTVRKKEALHLTDKEFKRLSRAQLIDIIQAVIFLFFAAEQFLSGYRQKLVVKSAQEELKRQAEQAAAEGSVK